MLLIKYFLPISLLVCSQVYSEPCETKRDVFIDNAVTKVWQTTICPHQPLPFHTHEHARVVIPEQSGLLKVIYQSGKESVIRLKKQTPILLPKSQGNSPHQDVNMSGHRIRVTVVELKQDKNG